MDLVRLRTRGGCQPLDDEDGRHKFLLNDGKEVKLMIGSYGHHITGHQPSEALQPTSPVLHDYLSNYSVGTNIPMTPKMRFKVSRATKVVEPEPEPVHDVIVIDDDDDDDVIVKVPSGSSRPYNIGSTTQVGRYLQPSQEQVQIGLDLQHLKLNDSRPVPISEECQNDCIPRFEIDELKTTVPTEVFQNLKQLALSKSEKVQCFDKPTQNVAQDMGLNLRVDTLESDLQEILDLIDVDFERGEPETFTKTKELCYQRGKVVYGEPGALMGLLEDVVSLKTGEHGVMVKALSPSSLNRYQCIDSDLDKKGQYSIVKDLGIGSFGKVQMCVDRSTNTEFVKKMIFKDFTKKEVTSLLFLDHPNIVQVFGFIQRNGVPEMFMEYGGTSLLHFALEPATYHQLNDSTIWEFTKQGLAALEYLDDNDIIHFDLKPENLCLLDKGDKLPQLKLTDFGSAKKRNEQLDFKGWTAEYMAPELGRAFLSSKNPNSLGSDAALFPVTGKADVFAFALVVLFMHQRRHVLMHFFTNGKDSYKDVENPDRVRFSIIVANVKTPDIVQRLMISDKCTDNMKTVLQGMLAGSPLGRLSAAEAIRKMKELETTVVQQPATASFLRSTFGNENHTQTLALQVSDHRRQSSVSSSALSSFDSNIGSPIGFPSSPGVVKLRAARRKQRRKVAQPYGNVNKDTDTNYKDLTPAENLEGNVPNFGLF